MTLLTQVDGQKSRVHQLSLQQQSKEKEMSQTSEKKLFSMRDQFETKLKVQQDKGEESVAKLQVLGG